MLGNIKVDYNDFRRWLLLSGANCGCAIGGELKHKRWRVKRTMYNAYYDVLISKKYE